MIERAIEIRSYLPPHLLLDRKFLVDGCIPDLQDLASYVGKKCRKSSHRERSLGLSRKNGGVEPHVVCRIELCAAGLLGNRVSGAVVEVGGLRHKRGRVRESEGTPGMGRPLRAHVPAPG